MLIAMSKSTFWDDMDPLGGGGGKSAYAVPTAVGAATTFKLRVDFYNARLCKAQKITPVWAELACTGHASLHDVVTTLLDHWRFDDSHMYSASLAGASYTGAAFEPPKPGRCPVLGGIPGANTLGAKLAITYDFGDNWEWEGKVVALAAGGAPSSSGGGSGGAAGGSAAVSGPRARVVASGGKPPKQYNVSSEGEDDEDDEESDDGEDEDDGDEDDEDDADEDDGEGDGEADEGRSETEDGGAAVMNPKGSAAVPASSAPVSSKSPGAASSRVAADAATSSSAPTRTQAPAPAHGRGRSAGLPISEAGGRPAKRVRKE
jgi:hypothetical protein